MLYRFDKFIYLLLLLKLIINFNRICTFTNNLIFTFYWQLFYGRFGFRALCSPNEF